MSTFVKRSYDDYQVGDSARVPIYGEVVLVGTLNIDSPVDSSIWVVEEQKTCRLRLVREYELFDVGYWGE